MILGRVTVKPVLFNDIHLGYTYFIAILSNGVGSQVFSILVTALSLPVSGTKHTVVLSFPHCSVLKLGLAVVSRLRRGAKQT